MVLDRFIARIVLGAVLFSLGLAMDHILAVDETVLLIVFLAGYIVVGYDIVLKAVRNIGHGQVFDENFLMVIATVGAFVIGEYPEAMAVMLFFQVGEWFERRAVNRTRGSISALMDLQPEYANLLRNGSTVKVNPEEVSVDDTIVVLPGERIPLDGIVIEGSTSVDTKALTGESVPRDLSPGENVISGTVNLSAKILVRVTKAYEDSTVTKVLELVEDSYSRKAQTERFITRFARVYTPIVVLSALCVAAIPIMMGYDASVWVYRALTFLVVSCPCALVISVPLGYFCGIGGASKMGVLVKGGNYLESLAGTKTVVFDKTGTLTEGRFDVERVHAIGLDEDELVRIAARAESVSNHPIAESIRRRHGGTDPLVAGEAEEIPGKGVRAIVDGKEYHVGNHRLMSDVGVEYCDEEVIGTNVHVAGDGSYLGHIVVSDVIKRGSPETVDDLRSLGVEHIVMLSGDSRAIVESVGGSLGIDEIHYEMLPSDKMDELERIMARGDGSVAYVGDGMNDAPALAMSDVGIAMGAMGSDAAIEAADIVIMDDDPRKIPASIRLAKRTRTIVLENIVFALAVKFTILVAATLGYADMWVAVFGDVGVSAIAILNAMRCLDIERIRPRGIGTTAR